VRNTPALHCAFPLESRTYIMKEFTNLKVYSSKEIYTILMKKQQLWNTFKDFWH